jgi:hypothetical protein
MFYLLVLLDISEMEYFHEIGNVGYARSDPDIPVVLPIRTMVFYFQFGICTITDDDEFGQTCYDVVIRHEACFYRDSGE